MKKILSFALTLALCLSVVVGLASCSHEHEYKTEWSKDATHHWHDCESCEEPGEKAAHTMGKDWQQDANDHWHVCSVCGEIGDKAAHSWGTPTKPSHGEYIYTCADCGQVKTDKKDVEVTEAEFTAAMDPGTNYTLSASAVAPDGSTSGTLVKRDGNKLMISLATTGDLAREITSYFSIEGDKVYAYSAVVNMQGELLGYEKLEETGATPEEFIESITSDLFPEEMRDYTLYTFNTETKLYEAASVTVASMGGALQNVELGFEDGKLVSYDYKIEISQEVFLPCNMTLSYGDTSITLPQPIDPIDTEVTEEEFNAAFDLGDNYTVTMSVMTPGGAMQMVVQRDENKFDSSYTTTPIGGTTTVNYGYAVIEDGKCYNFAEVVEDDDFKGYEKEEITGTTPEQFTAMLVAQNLPEEIRSFALLQYNENSKCYECASVTLASMGNRVLSNVALAFEEGKIVMFYYEADGAEYTLMFTYGDADVTLPTNIVTAQ